MMNNLTEIAKENGAIDMVDLATREYVGTKFTPVQLQATVEQVCKPLVDCLEGLEWSDWGYDRGGDGYARCPSCCGTQYDLGCSAHDSFGHKESCELNKSISIYRKLMGQE